MSKQFRLPKFWILALAQLALAVAIACIWFYFRTEAFLAGAPSGDLYANNWGFQLIAFVVVWLPGVLLITGILLAIEHQALKPYYLAQQTESARHAP
ncbi:hypothetical protein E2F46_16530 [Luteimonas aestuarii]|uniref:Uncharacterized protein n=1 Tax=Luteimonas aestuarii TaxID=453837 RepID=A0A4R5TMU3_9GAMM|nr:hypothetical protein [Luteimonas aestuarii]TDK19971.1 hypothetical protein E2F46_16530 [Luteimonas aestuarii]